jgi:hypothetical protein
MGAMLTFKSELGMEFKKEPELNLEKHELQASHVNKTITVPTEGLISELRAVEVSLQLM